MGVCADCKAHGKHVSAVIWRRKDGKTNAKEEPYYLSLSALQDRDNVHNRDTRTSTLERQRYAQNTQESNGVHPSQQFWFNSYFAFGADAVFVANCIDCCDISSRKKDAHAARGERREVVGGNKRRRG